MGAFTPVAGADIFDLAVANEIIGGIRERVQVTSGTPPALAVAGGDAHRASYWASLQTLVESICTSFYDSSVGAGGYAGAASISPFNLSAFRSAAGLHADGFRRATAWYPSVDTWTNLADPMFTYGVAQVGDIFGPWIYADLQAALSALRWTRLAAGAISGHERGTSGVGEGATCDEAMAMVIATYELGWGVSAYPHLYACESSLTPTGGGAYQAGSFRWSSLIGSSDPRLPLLSQSIDSYELFNGDVFLDYDHLGVPNGTYRFFETLPTDAAASRTRSGGEFGMFEPEPFSISGLSCPTDGTKNIHLADVCWIAKWEFTNS